ncbi:MAG: hypothetical protein NTW07_00060, partial [candidate division Zixibacteria bacterium]|nr:hypothetical protein [candidate division Zixibacteria bacterium]
METPTPHNNDPIAAQSVASPVAVSARDTIVTGVLFKDETDNVPNAFQCRLVDLLGDTHLVRDSKKGTPCFSLATYAPNTTRKKANVLAVTGILLDFDHLTKKDIETVYKGLVTERIAFAMYTTFSHLAHGVDDNCVRVAVLASRHMNPGEARAVREELLVAIGVDADDSTTDASRIWYLPSCPQERADTSFISYYDAPPLQVDAFLAQAASRLLDSPCAAVPQAPPTSDQLRKKIEALKDTDARDLFEPVLNGQPFAQDGKRDIVCWKLISTIAFLAPDATPESILEFLTPSLSVMAKNEPAGALTPEVVLYKAKRALQDARDHRASSFKRGDEVELAQKLLDLLLQSGPVVYDRGQVYQYNAGTGLWAPLPHEQLSNIVQGFAGRTVYGTKQSILRISSRAVGGSITLAEHRLSRPGFFSEARRGMAFSNGFVEVSLQGVQVWQHHPDNRATFGFAFPYDPSAKAPLFHKFLTDIFIDDQDGEQKRALLQEFVGACLVGVATSMAKALVFLGEGRNGKSTLIRIIEALFGHV